MTTSGRIRVGVVGANAARGFARLSHMPALQALADFEIVAVCTTREQSAAAAAKAC
jgi:predicted dehydrogenase